MKSISKVILLSVLFSSVIGCTRIETGEVGLRRSWNGEIQSQELGTGWHQIVLGDVIHFVTKEIMLHDQNILAQTKDKSTLQDFDINFTYSVAPSSIAELYTKYSQTAHLVQKDGSEIFPMGNFVGPIVRSAAYSSVSGLNALEVNDNRKTIEDNIKRIANEKLAGEGLKDKIHVSLVSIRNLQLAPEIVASANRAVQAQNDYNTKKTEVEIARQEAAKIEALSKQGDDNYIRLLEAQSRREVAEALKIAAEKGSSVWVVPQNFTSLGKQ